MEEEDSREPCHRCGASPAVAGDPCVASPTGVGRLCRGEQVKAAL